MAPSWMDFAISCIFAVPVGRLRIVIIMTMAYRSARMLIAIAQIGTCIFVGLKVIGLNLNTG